ncbi:hypothetical protein BU16DRAFT_522015 [Lophium mytilinum]|uniref:Transmembrane protein n=1 Tax=Lophium mytilinum TaxID=390894 RepID=A0A6A6RB03_9PEZI|nr:hypothetical protein BU16DRAFT_522015 [Lophium mytilinum]
MDDGSQNHEPRHDPPLHQDSGFDEPLLFDDEPESSSSEGSLLEVESRLRLPLLPLASRGFRARPEEELLPRWAGCLIILVGFGWAVWCALYIPAMFEGAFGWDGV